MTTVRASQVALLALGKSVTLADVRVSQAALLVLAKPGSTPATVISVSPNVGTTIGGTSVTIVGTSFTGATDVKFNGTSATSIVIVDATHITCDTPAHALGAVNVQVFTPAAGNPTLVNGYTYSDDAIARITQLPVLVLDVNPQVSRITQLPILVLYQEEQPNRVTQVPILVMVTPKPVPLPTILIPEIPLYESWEWLTVMSTALSGQEQRGRLREVPRYRLQINVIITNEDERRSVYNMLMRFLKTPFLYPFFQYNTEITQLAEVGDTKIFADTNFTDVRDGETIALFDPYLEQIHYLAISTVDMDGVNLAVPLAFDVLTYWQICPAILFHISPVVGLNMRSIEGSMSLTMESIKPRVFRRPGVTPTVTTIDGILIVPERPLANEDVPENFDIGNTWFDNKTSIPDVLNEWSNPRVSSKVTFNYDRKTDSDYWRTVCQTLRGRQNVALFPTFRNDLPLREGIALNVSQFTTFNIDFYLWSLELNYRYIMLTTANGVKYRRIISVDPFYNSDGNPEYLIIKLATSIGNTAGDNDISSISYMNLCRLDSDTVKLNHFALETEIELTIKAVNQ